MLWHMKLMDWCLDQSFQDDLLRWIKTLQWISGKGQVSFMELAMDSKSFAQPVPLRAPASPQVTCRVESQPLLDHANVLKQALAVLQRNLVLRHILLGWGVVAQGPLVAEPTGPHIVASPWSHPPCPHSMAVAVAKPTGQHRGPPGEVLSSVFATQSCSPISSNKDARRVGARGWWLTQGPSHPAITPG